MGTQHPRAFKGPLLILNKIFIYEKLQLVRESPEMSSKCFSLLCFPGTGPTLQVLQKGIGQRWDILWVVHEVIVFLPPELDVKALFAEEASLYALIVLKPYRIHSHISFWPVNLVIIVGAWETPQTLLPVNLKAVAQDAEQHSQAS